MEEILRTLLIGLVTLGIAWVTYFSAVRKAKSDTAQRAEEERLAQQEEITALRKAQTEALTTIMREFLEEKKSREELQRRFDALLGDHHQIQADFATLKQEHEDSKKRIETLEEERAARDAKISLLQKSINEKNALVQELTDALTEMNTRLETIEGERNELKVTLVRRELELKQRDETIAHLEAKVEGFQKRLDEMEKKSTADELNPAAPPNVPLGTPEGTNANDAKIDATEKE